MFAKQKKEVYMFGLWFSIVGLLFGTLCSLKAKEKNRVQKDWFTLGFVFSVFAFVIIYLLPATETDSAAAKYSEEGHDVTLFMTN